MLFHRFGDTIYAIIYGKLLTAAAQGTLGGLGFWILGLPAPWFWGLVMGLYVFGATYSNRDKHPEYMPYAVGVWLASAAFFR